MSQDNDLELVGLCLLGPIHLDPARDGEAIEHLERVRECDTEFRENGVSNAYYEHGMSNATVKDFFNRWGPHFGDDVTWYEDLDLGTVDPRVFVKALRTLWSEAPTRTDMYWRQDPRDLYSCIVFAGAQTAGEDPRTPAFVVLSYAYRTGVHKVYGIS